MLAVSDTGVGMDAATQERIFEPFFTTKPAGKGTGLGLSTVYGIVKQTGGHIAVYSELNLGTTFRVYLPASALPVPEESSKPKITTLHGTETILLVEDDASLREYASGVLRDFGYQVYEAGGGEEAIAIGRAKANKIDLLVTDVVMPEMGGRDLTDALASVAPRIRVLYMSGYTEAAIVHRGVLDPGIEFLAKPFSPDELAMRVREVLATPLRPRSILIVDDDPGILSLLTTILTDTGYQVSVASNGNEAISHCRGKVVDLLITDLVMPEREGIETIRYFRKEVPYAKIIAISGAFDEQMLRVANVLGAHATLQKPIRPDELLGGVRRLIG
jgi:CheY-like chemotaxis protein